LRSARPLFLALLLCGAAAFVLAGVYRFGSFAWLVAHKNGLISWAGAHPLLAPATWISAYLALALFGLPGSTVLNAKAPMVISRNFKPGFRIRLHQKDLRNALLAAESMKVPLPLTSLVQQMLMSLMNEGKGDLDHSGIVNFTESLANIRVEKPS